MAFKFSTGFRDNVLDTGSVKAQLDGGFIKIYAGTVPADADASIGAATLLCTISDNGGAGGLTMEAAAVSGVLSKLSSQVWKGTNAAGGTATFFRFVQAADDGSASTTAPRVQGNIGVAGADMNLSNVVLTNGLEQVIDYFSIALPTL